jgi:4-hydroxybenzoate polyprenyltransferase
MVAEAKLMLHKVKIILEMIKFEHTIFALPFAFTERLTDWRHTAQEKILWITVAMVGALCGHGINRWADRNSMRQSADANRALPGLI